MIENSKGRKMQSIFILGASRLQLPAIKKAKEKGLYVYVLDYDPKAPGIQFADQYLEISTIDKEAVYNAANIYKPDYIITSTSDMPVRTVSWVCEKLGKKTDISYEGSILATNKIAMRNKMKECGIPIPLFFEAQSLYEFRSIAKEMPDRFILKPADNSASRGVILIDKNVNSNLDELYKYCVQYSRSGEVLLEEYMEGPEVSVEAYSKSAEVCIHLFVTKAVFSSRIIPASSSSRVIISKLLFSISSGRIKPHIFTLAIRCHPFFFFWKM